MFRSCKQGRHEKEINAKHLLCRLLVFSLVCYCSNRFLNVTASQICVKYKLSNLHEMTSDLHAMVWLLKRGYDTAGA